LLDTYDYHDDTTDHDNDEISDKLYHLLAEFMGLGLFISIRPATIMWLGL